MQNITLRVTKDNGQRYDLNVKNDVSFLVDISAIENNDIGKIFGIVSQNIQIPGDDNSNIFFNHLFDLGSTPPTALLKSVDCQILVDGESIFKGKLILQDVITDQYNDIVYNCLVTNETIDFKTLIENKTLSELNWDQYNHSSSYASISQSWNDQLFNGDIFYPLVNYGVDSSIPKAAAFEFGGKLGMMDNPNTPLKLTQFRPAIRAKSIVDNIFDSINYKYTSSFLDSDYSSTVYSLFSTDDKDNISYINPISSSAYVYSNVSQSVASQFTTVSDLQLNFATELWDDNNLWNTGSSVYTANMDGTHTFNIQIPFSISSNSGPLVPVNAGRRFNLWVYKNGSRERGIQYPLKTIISGSINTGDIKIDLVRTDTVTFKFQLFTPSSNGIEQFTTITSGSNGVYCQITGPQNPIGGTVNIGKIFPTNIKSLDYIKGLNEKYNLIITPVDNQNNLLSIEPYNDWIQQGVKKDWTSKVDRTKKYKIEHPIGQQPKKIVFSDDTDSDVLNTYQNQTFKNTYGGLVYTSNSDIPNGEKKIGGFFAATPVKQIPGGNTTVMPWLNKETTGKPNEPFKFKPRILHKTERKTIPDNEMKGTFTGSLSVPSGSTFYYIQADNQVDIHALNFYKTLLPTTDSPTDFTSSLDIHYSNIGYWPFQQQFVNGQCRDGVYNRYWAYYINSLYDIDARKLTCNILLTPSDIKTIKLNDKIFIDGHYWRINKISSANLTQPKSTEVEFIKVLSRNIGFNGRQRIDKNDAGGGGVITDGRDVIINGLSRNGKVTFGDFQTGEEITDVTIIKKAASLNGFGFDGQQAYWNIQSPIVYNPSVISYGNNPINETLHNGVLMGNGNQVGDNVSDFYIMGDNNIVESGLDHITMMANSSSITDSQRIILIQASGSRVVSSSQDNVIINAINDIQPNDPTGSVYVGNLIGQGNSEFKQDLTVNGNLYVSGSVVNNGISTETFNHDFGFNLTSTIYSVNTSSFNYSDISYKLSSGSFSSVGNFKIAYDGLNKVFTVLPTSSVVFQQGPSVNLISGSFTNSNFDIQIGSSNYYCTMSGIITNL